MLSHSWTALEGRLRDLFEAGGSGSPISNSLDDELEGLGLMTALGEITDTGTAYVMARFIANDNEEARVILGILLSDITKVRQFCGALWGRGTIPVSGAVTMLRRLMGLPDERQARRWLDLMNRGRLVVYNRSRPTVGIVFNPDSLAPPNEDTQRAQAQNRLISPETPYRNLLALKGLLENAKNSIRWYEKHLPPKVMEVLYQELPGERVSEIRLLSGPGILNKKSQDEFRRFKSEMMSQRGIRAEWRVLSGQGRTDIHDRFFISDGLSVNLPPLNSVLKGSTGEILPSDVDADTFDEWWQLGTDLLGATPQDGPQSV